MVQAVYVDVLFIVNFIINYLLLRVANRFNGRQTHFGRLIAASVVGALGAMAIFLPPVSLVWEIVGKLALCLVMVVVANKPLGWWSVAKECFVFFTISFLLAGVLLGLFVAVNPKNMLYYNGIVYFDISATLLIFNICIAYVVAVLFDKLLRGAALGSAQAGSYRVHFSLFGKETELTGMVDSGNNLREPFSDIPVVVCGLEAVQNILPLEVCEILAKEESMMNMDFSAMSKTVREHFRAIPYKGVDSQGILPAFKADYMELSTGTLTLHIENVYVAISRNAVGTDAHKLLLSPLLTKTKTAKEVCVK